MIESVLSYLKVILIDHIADWLITAIITYFAVKVGTKHYYEANRVETSKHIMQFGIKSMINLGYSEPVPDFFKVIFVEYGKRAFFLTKRQIEKLERKGYKKKCFGLKPDLRRTVTSQGKSTMQISEYKPENYGVLGAANLLESVLRAPLKTHT